MSVFVLDFKGVPVMPCTERRARLLLARGRARVHRLVPFVIRLTDRAKETCALQPLRIKLDPGSKTTGLTLVRDIVVVDLATGEVTTGSFNIQTGSAVVQDIFHRHCKLAQRADGYAYFFNVDSSLDAGSGRAQHDALSLPGMNAEVSRAILG